MIRRVMLLAGWVACLAPVTHAAGRKNDASSDCYVQIVGFAAEP